MVSSYTPRHNKLRLVGRRPGVGNHRIQTLPGRAAGGSLAGEVSLLPFYQVHRQRSAVYWRRLDRASDHCKQGHECGNANFPHLGATRRFSGLFYDVRFLSQDVPKLHRRETKDRIYGWELSWS